MTKIFSSIRFGLAAAVLTALPAIAGAVRPVYTGPTQAEREAATLKKYDRNHNGVIDPAERKRMQVDAYRTKVENFDYNGNGRLGAAELAAARTTRIEKLILMLDVSRDGRLSFAEARRRGMDSNLVEKFRLIDTNHDRLLSKREMLASPYVQPTAVYTRPYWNYWTSA